MRVLHIFNELKFSGAEIMYADAAGFFKSKGCDLTAMVTGKSIGDFASKFDEFGYDIVHKNMPHKLNFFKIFFYALDVISYIKKNSFEVIHIHSSSARWIFSICAWIADVKSVYTFHNVFKSRLLTYPLHFIQRKIIKHIFKCEFHTISDSVHDNELKYYYNRTKKIYNWYDNHRFYPAKKNEKNLLRKELGIKKHTLVLISIGGCSWVKRHTDIIKALPLVIKKNEDCLYLHLGTGPLEEYEKKLVSKLSLNKNVRFCGNQINVRKYLIASDIYLMPSRFEGISITTIEAMACKIPSILYNVPGLKDFNSTGYNSILIEEDYRTMALEIIKLYSNTLLKKKLSFNAMNLVNDVYNMENNANKIFNLYNT